VNNLVYIADSINHVICVVNRTSNIITKFAGTTATSGNSASSGLATSAQLSTPADMAIDTVRNKVYIADSTNNFIRVVDRNTGLISTFAGGSSSGLSKLYI
jgi:DNA-binding beta-propeller fold protein YncE